MPVRIPASELYQIQEEDLRNAIDEFRRDALPPTFEDSTRFDLGQHSGMTGPVL